MPSPHLSNALARRLFLDRHGLLKRPSGSGKGHELASVVDDLGFVQVDSIRTVARAHDHILFTRCPAYRAGNLPPLLEKTRSLFEAWTHDAALVPVGFFPQWRHKFERSKGQLHKTWSRLDGRAGFDNIFDHVLRRLDDEGPLTAGELGEGNAQNGGGWWDWSPTKTALEYLWRTGEVMVCHRRGFTKAYALTEHVIPPEWLNHRIERAAAIDWSAKAALTRLGFGTASDLSRFWEIFDKPTLAQWCNEACVAGDIVQGTIDTTQGRKPVFLPENWEDTLAKLSTPSSRVRILSPFDPALRDRTRAERLFGFEYRIEVFVPEAKRVYGCLLYTSPSPRDA